MIPSSAARRLFLGAQGLLADPKRRATKAELLKTIQGMGFVQVDTINVAGRAHDLTLFSRLEGYRPTQLASLLEKDRSLFEGWTHDASVIPSVWYPQWKPRFRRDKPRIEAHPWWRNLLGEEASTVCSQVLERITTEGPLGSADFEHPEKRGLWWGWKPQKAALDYLWRTGRLGVAGRVNFQKRYDLVERLFPGIDQRAEPAPDEHLEWVCSTAAERLLVFTAKELAAFWSALDAAEVRPWCHLAIREGRILPALIEAMDGAEPQAGFVVQDWEKRLANSPEGTPAIRLLSPFDPVVRDRARALRRFGFDYRFEAFVPEPKRVYGYFVFPLLEGEELVGRIDLKLHRNLGYLEVRGLWWEFGIRATKARMKKLNAALEGMAGFLGAKEIVGL
ncbi:MAG: crosslink repair DNA glycosylase YcaQ family protein [Holophaga sp.]|nr:crosslink repair DNA glycosylase YcaQ family protein [Holophaga sp.]